MAATLSHAPVSGPEWVFERKLDGIRLLAFKQGPRVQLLSRNRLPRAEHYPSIAAAIAGLPHELVLDGEVTGVWGEGQPLGYHVFDLLWLDGEDLTALPLEARRERLEGLRLAPPLQLVERLADDAPWERARRQGWEGIIAKRRGTPYEHRRSPHWLKIKNEASQELVIGGFTEPRGQRRGLGALLVGYFDDDELVFAGKVGTGAGFDARGLVQLRAELDAIETPTSPFTRATGLPRADVHWVRPERVVQVAFLEWTAHGKLRHPRLLGPRPDKAAREVRREMQ